MIPCIHLSSLKTDNFRQSILRLLDCIKQINDYNDAETPELDLGKIDFIRPSLALYLFFIKDIYLRKGTKVSILEDNLTQDLRGYLQRIGFENNSYLSVDTIKNYSERSYLPIVSFPVNNDKASHLSREIILSALTDLIKKIALPPQSFQALAYLITESTNNISDHSQAEKGYLFAQYFKSNSFIEVCIPDNRIGLLGSYKSSHLYSDITSDKAALTGKSTKELNGTRGFGLSTSQNIVTIGFRQAFFLLSGSSFAIYNRSTQNLSIANLDQKYYHRGCLVVLRIPSVFHEGFNFYSHLG